MNDYKELIGDIGDLLIAHPSEILSKRYLCEAANAIEQLIEAFEHCKSELDITRKFIKDNDLVWELNSYCRRK